MVNDDPFNATSVPADNDKDGIPDIAVEDDDNGGSRYIEEEEGVIHLMIQMILQTNMVVAFTIFQEMDSLRNMTRKVSNYLLEPWK